MSASGSDSDGMSAADAFAVLGNETRMKILQALWQADGPMSFTELRRAVAPDDRGNFNYHVGRLTDHFVRKIDEVSGSSDSETRGSPPHGGYVLQFAGEQVVRAVLAGTITDAPSVPPEEIDERCAYCGSTVEMAYEGEVISVRCTGCGGVVGSEFPRGTYMHYEFPPAGLVGRSREAAVDAGHVFYDSKIAPMMKGVCPECAGRTSLSFEICDEHEVGEAGLCPNCDTRCEVWSVYECERCRYTRQSVVWFAALNHPATIAFYHEHGLTETIPFRKLTGDNAEFVREITATVVETDPYRFRVTIPVEAETLIVTMDESLDVLDAERETNDDD